jgi:NTP pyrophosphatase (non-canonical NTP hydrolase)
MRIKDKNALYFNAWKKWGTDLQVNTLVEEMAELIQANMKARRNGTIFNHSFYEELADVEIMVEQMKVILSNLPSENGENKYDIVKRIKNKKLNRLFDWVYNKGNLNEKMD